MLTHRGTIEQRLKGRLIPALCIFENSALILSAPFLLPQDRKYYRLFPFSDDYNCVIWYICTFNACLQRLFDFREKGKTGETKPIKHLDDLTML